MFNYSHIMCEISIYFIRPDFITLQLHMPYEMRINYDALNFNFISEREWNIQIEQNIFLSRICEAATGGIGVEFRELESFRNLNHSFRYPLVLKFIKVQTIMYDAILITSDEWITLLHIFIHGFAFQTENWTAYTTRIDWAIERRFTSRSYN